MYKTTKKQFEQFKKECQRWITFFGLTEWHIYYQHVELSEPVYALCKTDMLGMNANLIFNKKIEDGLKSDIKRTAFHEVCELLLAKLNIQARCRFVTKEELETSNHEIIVRLENCVYERLK